MKKPSWMPKKTWSELLARYNGVPRCKITGATDNLSIDHTNPRWNGGADTADNLEFLSDRLNAIKGIRPDTHWRQRFFFDETPNFSALRTAQNDGYKAIITYTDWFSQPLSDIARFLYTFGWVVGAGKTLGSLVISCAVNALINNKYGVGYARRADRILILAKEQSIRDQIANDLMTLFGPEPGGYGVFSRNPRVKVIVDGWQWDETINLDSYDVVVACLAQLYGDNRPTNFERILHEFPIIIIDEPHYAWQQVLAIVEAATTSLCFGFTGTPIHKTGQPLLDRMILVNVHGYDDADEGDRSMKFLDEKASYVVRELQMTEATAMRRGILEIIDDANEAWYMKNIEPAKNVLREVIQEMHRRDKLNLAMEIPAPHRRDISSLVSFLYSTHGMLAAPNVVFGNILCDLANQLFDSNRAIYPVEDGWRAEIVFADAIESDGKKRVGKPLTTDHPWLRAKNLPGYKADAMCARLIIVIGMAREGVSNPLCGVIGVVSASQSLLEAVQRWLGRQIRSVVKWRADGVLLVPPEALDRVLIITHQTFRVVPIIQEAIDFTLNMRDRLAGLNTIANLLSTEDPTKIKQPEEEVLLPNAIKIKIAGILGGGLEDIIDGDRWPVPTEGENLDGYIVKAVVGVPNPDDPRLDDNTKKLVKKTRDWINLVQKEPRRAGELLGIKANKLQEISTVFKELIDEAPTGDDLQMFIRSYYPELAGIDISTDPGRQQLCQALYLENRKQSRLPPLVATNTLDGIRKTIASDVSNTLGGHLKLPDRKAKDTFYILIARAIKDLVGCPSFEQARISSKYDNPYTHAILQRPDVHNEAKSWVMAKLIDKGFCPSLKMLRS